MFYSYSNTDDSVPLESLDGRAWEYEFKLIRQMYHNIISCSTISVAK